MKVSIRLNSVPSFLMTMIKAQNEWAEDQDHCGFNPDQSLSLEGNVLSFTGQRCPFGQDGSLSVFRAALMGVERPVEASSSKEWHEESTYCFIDAKLVAYESSDSRLRWWETLDHYLASRATTEELLAHVAKTANKYWEKPTLEDLVLQWPRLKGLARQAQMLALSPARFNAEFGVDERGNVRRLISLVS